MDERLQNEIDRQLPEIAGLLYPGAMDELAATPGDQRRERFYWLFVLIRLRFLGEKRWLYRRFRAQGIRQRERMAGILVAALLERGAGSSGPEPRASD